MKKFNVGDAVVADKQFLCRIVNIAQDDKGVDWYECELIGATIAAGITREFTIQQLEYFEETSRYSTPEKELSYDLN